jgi:hypothetical protein
VQKFLEFQKKLQDEVIQMEVNNKKSLTWLLNVFILIINIF